MSALNRPYVADILPLINLLFKHFEIVQADISKSPLVHAAAEKAEALLEKYYSKTDDSVVYRIAIQYLGIFICALS